MFISIISSLWDKRTKMKQGGILIILTQDKDNYFLAWKLATFSKRRVWVGPSTLSVPPGSINCRNPTKIASHGSHCSAAVGFRGLLSPSLWLIIMVAQFPFLISHQKLWCFIGREGNPPSISFQAFWTHLSRSTCAFLPIPEFLDLPGLGDCVCEQACFNHLIREPEWLPVWKQVKKIWVLNGMCAQVLGLMLCLVLFQKNLTLLLAALLKRVLRLLNV